MRPDPASDASHRNASGDVRTAISDGLVALLKQYHGRDPEQSKTYVSDDLAVCLLRGRFARASSRRCSRAVTATTSSANAWPSRT